jgi:hypothetical protein
LHPTKQVHYTNFQLKTRPMLAMQNAPTLIRSDWAAG